MASHVKVVDLAQAVTTELERVGQHANSVFADVEGVASEVRRPRVTIRDKHVCQRSAVQNRPFPSLIRVRYGVQDQPLARSETNTKTPLLPADLVAFDDEAWALRLVNFDGLQVRSGT